MSDFSIPGRAQEHSYLKTDWAAPILRLMHERGVVTTPDVGQLLQVSNHKANYYLTRLNEAGMVKSERVKPLSDNIRRQYRLADPSLDVTYLPRSTGARRERARGVALTLSGVARQYALALENGAVEVGPGRTLVLERKPIRVHPAQLETANALIERFVRDFEELSSEHGDLITLTLTLT